MKTLETERLILRNVIEDDYFDMYDYATDINVGPNAGWPEHKSIEESKKICKIMNELGNDYALILKENNKMIGTLGIIYDRKLDEVYGSQVELGYVLNPKYHHLGLMSEAISEVKKYIFEELKIDNIIVAHFYFNEASKKVILRNDFKYIFKKTTSWPLINKEYETYFYICTREMYYESKYKIDYFKCLNSRFSARKFETKKVEKEKIDILVDMLKISPSAVNYKSVRLFVIDDDTTLNKLNDATRFLFCAPLAIIVTHDKEISWHRKRDNKDHGIIDSSIVATNIMNSCYALGLGTTYVSSFNDVILHDILNIPLNYEINCILPIGYILDGELRKVSHTDNYLTNVFYNGKKYE